MTRSLPAPPGARALALHLALLLAPGAAFPEDVPLEPVRFEANHGQASEDVRFLGRSRGLQAGFTPRGVTLRLTDGAAAARGRTIAIEFRGARVDARPRGEGPLRGRANYLLGEQRDAWIRDVPLFREVHYADLYPGVDLAAYGRAGRLEYDFVVYPGGTPESIGLRVVGADHVTIDEDGRWVTEVAGERIVQEPPEIYQLASGSRRGIRGRFRIEAGDTVRFEVEEYDPTRPLIIDPVLGWSTYLGGSAADGARGITIDSAGDVIVAGSTRSANFSFTSGALQGPIPPECRPIGGGLDCETPIENAFVMKFDPRGALLFSTYLGGEGIDAASGVDTDPARTVWVTGATYSADFPTTSGAYQRGLRGVVNDTPDAFVARLSADGSDLLWSSYLGGSGRDEASGIEVITLADIGPPLRFFQVPIVVGTTSSRDFPAAGAATPAYGGGISDAFVTVFDEGGSALASSRTVGGGGTDRAHAVARDGQNYRYVAGSTDSVDFPLATPLQGVRAGGQDAFLAKLQFDGTLVFSTYIGGSGPDAAHGIPSRGESIFMVGTTGSPDFPVTPGAHRTAFAGGDEDAFVSRIRSDGQEIIASTLLGGGREGGGPPLSGNDRGRAVALALDGTDDVLITGVTWSPTFPRLGAGLSRPDAHSGCAFLTRLGPDLRDVRLSTPIGGSDGYDRGEAVATDASDRIFVAGATSSDEFPVLNPIAGLGGSEDAFVTSLVPPESLVADLRVRKEVTTEGPIEVGDIVTYRIRVDNLGPSPAYGVILEDVLPPTVDFVDASADGGTCDPPRGRTVRCRRDSIAPGFGFFTTIRVRTTDGGIIENTASVVSEVTDPDPTNDEAAVAVEVFNQDLVADALEVTQGIQNLANDVPLVTRKYTIVRAYARALRPGGPITLPGVRAVLHGRRDGAALPGSPLASLEPSTTLRQGGWDRASYTDSFNFFLPREWRKGREVELRVEVDPDRTFREPREDNNDTAVTVRFFDAVPICLDTSPVLNTEGAPSADYLRREPGLHITRRALSMLPTYSVRIFPNPSILAQGYTFGCSAPSPLDCFVPYDLGSDTFFGLVDQGSALIGALWWRDQFSDDPDWCDRLGARTHYVGMVLDGGSKCCGKGTGTSSAPFAARDQLWFVLRDGSGQDVNGAPVNDAEGGGTLAHELGHNYGRPHTDCGGPDDPGPYPYGRCTIGPDAPDAFFGFDTVASDAGSRNGGFSPVPPSLVNSCDAAGSCDSRRVGDLMSYAAPRWPSDYTWRRILLSLHCRSRWDCLESWREIFDDIVGEGGGAATAPGPVAVAPPDGAGGADGDFLLVWGLLASDGRVAHLRSQRADATIVPPEKLETLRLALLEARGDEEILLLDAGGEELLRDDFAAAPIDDGEDVRQFGFAVRWDDRTREVRIVRGESPLHAIPVSPRPPEVEVLSPNGGEVVDDVLEIAWEGSDPDPGSELLYTVQYSPDDGETWIALASEYALSSLEVSARFLEGALETARIRVTASDGIHSAIDESDGGFTVVPHAPEPLIEAPRPHQLFPDGSRIVLVGSAYDAEDGYLEPEQLAWWLDGEPAGTGDEIVLDPSSTGRHELRLDATDGDGVVGSATVIFWVGERDDPAGPRFRRGDANADGGLDLSDAIYTLQWLFTGGPAPSCESAADVDDSAAVDVTDPIFTLNYLFQGGSPPRAPGSRCGPDPTADDLPCRAYAPCP